MKVTRIILFVVALAILAEREALVAAYCRLPLLLLPSIDLDFLEHPWQSFRIIVQLYATELCFSLLILVPLLNESTSSATSSAQRYQWRPTSLILALTYTVFFFAPTLAVGILPRDPQAYFSPNQWQSMPSVLREFLNNLNLARKLTYIWPFTRFLTVLQMFMWCIQPRSVFLPNPVRYNTEFRLYGLENLPMKVVSGSTIEKEETRSQQQQKKYHQSRPIEQLYDQSTLGSAFKLYWQRRNAALAKYGPPASPAGLTAVALNEQFRRESTPSDLASIKRQALWNLLCKILGHLVIIDVLDSIANSETLGATSGAGGLGTDAYKHLYKGLGPWLVGFTVLTMNMTLLDMLYAILVCVAIVVTPSSNTIEVLANWSPMWLNRPYLAQSIRSLWSTHWHSLLRPVLSVLAYEPAEALVSAWCPSLGRPAGVLAAFLLSGIIHEVGFYPAARFVPVQEQSLDMKAGFGAGNFGTTRFFLLSAVAIIFETWFKACNIERHLARFLLRRTGSDLLIKNRWLRATLARLWTAAYLLWIMRLFLDLLSLLIALCASFRSGGFMALVKVLCLSGGLKKYFASSYLYRSVTDTSPSNNTEAAFELSVAAPLLRREV